MTYQKTTELGDKLQAKLRIIKGMADMLMGNGSFKNGAAADQTPQLDDIDESVLQEAIHILADQSHIELIELLDLLVVPLGNDGLSARVRKAQRTLITDDVGGCQ
jgi:hypothetical protein